MNRGDASLAGVEPVTTQSTQGEVDLEAIKRHYENLADSYDEFLYWSGDFVGRLTDEIVAQLQLQPDDKLLDLAGGTGMYSLAILERVPLQERVVVVDPFPQMLAKIPQDAPIDPVEADVVDYSSDAPRFDKILMKEAIHHVDRKRELFANLYESLTPNGRFLMVHVDPTAVAYPLFDAALENACNTFANPDEMVRMLEEAGFKAEKSQLPYDHDVPTDHYHRMVRTGYMSILTSLSDEETEAGIEEMERRHAGMDRLQFTETFSYVLGVKP